MSSPDDDELRWLEVNRAELAGTVYGDDLPPKSAPGDDLVAWLTQIWDEQEKEVSSVGAPDGFYPEPYEHGSPMHHASVLARIAADRQILALHRKVGFAVFTMRGEPEQRERYCEICQRGDEDELVYPCPTIRLLASAYADRPGYREEWRPE